MKYILKGIGLGLSLNLLSRLCGSVFYFHETFSFAFFSILFFAAVTTSFLISDKLSNLFLCGITGLTVMFSCEIYVFLPFFPFDFCYLTAYFYGMFGSIAGTFVAAYLTSKQTNDISKECNIMSKNLKWKLIFYVIFSSIGFSYLVLPEQSGISVPIFTLLQFCFLWHLVPDRKKLFWMIPIFLLSMNSFLSASSIWRPWNLVLGMVLYCCMFSDLSLHRDDFSFLSGIPTRFADFLRHFHLPFLWILEFNKEKTPIVKRVAIALAIAVPSVILLVLVLSSADMVFQIKAEGLMSGFTHFLHINTICKGAAGILLSLFLFDVLYQSHTYRCQQETATASSRGDLIIINILLSSILLVYTLFMVIQFRYLFAGSMLPDGLTYTMYARKGFFELLSLTGVNIAIILVVTKLTKQCDGTWYVFSKILCHYLCVVTIVLLVSSFYRMFLYTQDDGLTRLRFFVLGFLVFEAIGLFITFLYITKPRFNLTLVFLTLALGYYIILNLIPVDNIIATNQIQRYLKGARTEIDYVFTLSADAVPALKSLQNQTDDPDIKGQIDSFIQRRTTTEIPHRWQRYNLSVENAKR